MVKGVYVLMNLVALALGVWKVNGMGLLPYVYFSGKDEWIGLIVWAGQRGVIGLPGRRHGYHWSRQSSLLNEIYFLSLTPPALSSQIEAASPYITPGDTRKSPPVLCIGCSGQPCHI